MKQTNSLSQEIDSLDSSVVKLTGAQTISGTKTFISQPRRQSIRMDITVNPDYYVSNNGFQFIDKNGNSIGFLENAQNAGTIYTAIHALNKDGYQQSIGIRVPFEGTSGAYGFAPTMPTSDLTSNHIVTSQYITNKFQFVSVLPVTQDPNVFYFIAE